MDKIIFLVQGSASDPYIVEFQKKVLSYSHFVIAKLDQMGSIVNIVLIFYLGKMIR
jgi:hypothetical protein